MDEAGNHRIRTQIGFKAFGLDEVGALEFALTKIGTGVVETRKLSSSAFGGPGLPLAADKLRRALPQGTTPELQKKAGG